VLTFERRPGKIGELIVAQQARKRAPQPLPGRGDERSPTLPTCMAFDESYGNLGVWLREFCQLHQIVDRHDAKSDKIIGTTLQRLNTH
jgi:hypothetical protein